VWTAKYDQVPESVDIDVHLYTSATLKIPTNSGSVEFTQQSDWSLDGLVEFSLTAPESMDVTLRLRIPSWAAGWEVNISSYLSLFYVSSLKNTC
jgi:DUF1680 family protein